MSIGYTITNVGSFFDGPGAVMVYNFKALNEIMNVRMARPQTLGAICLVAIFKMKPKTAR
jgi:hypothetical protein